MRDILEKKVKSYRDPARQYHALREGLQHLILKILFRYLAFMGGTALRVIYDIRRFSEDLDFSLQKIKEHRFHFSALLKAVSDRLHDYRFSVDMKSKQTGAVNNVFFRFSRILPELDLAKRPTEKISIKLKVDTNPPLHAACETSLVQKEFIFSVIHHDLSTLFAGKLSGRSLFLSIGSSENSINWTWPS